MKQLIILVALMCVKTGFAQDTLRRYFSLTYSNNGQIADAVNDFYFKPRSDYDLRQSIFKVNAAYSFRTQKGIEFGLQSGYGQRRDRYPQANGGKTHTARQNYYSVTAFALKTWQFDRFHIAAGGGIPLNVISEYSLTGNDYQDQPFKTTFDGGITIGLNSITQLRFFLTERLSLTSSVQFGWMYAELGGTFASKPDDPDYQAVWMVEEERVLRKTVFTSPEFFFGIGFRF